MSDHYLQRRTQEEISPTMRELAMVLFRQGKLFVVLSGLILVLAIIYACSCTTYRAHMRVLVRRGRADPPVTAQPNAPPDFSRMEVTEEELNSEGALLVGTDVLRRVVEANHLSAHDWLRWLRPREEEAARVERAAKKLADRLEVETIKKTNLIAVSYDASDPQTAAKVLQSLATVYLEKHTKLSRPEGQLHFFDQQTAQSRRQLLEAEASLMEFTNTHGVVMAAHQRDLTLQRVDDLEGKYRNTLVEISEAAFRVQELSAQLSKLPERTITQVRMADNPELLRALKASLLDLELKKTQLLTKFEPSHRLVLEVEQQISQTETVIAAEQANPLRDETTDRSANYEWAKSELQKARVEMKGLEARKAAISGHLAQYRTLARQLGQDAITQEELTSGEKAALDNYLLYARKREEARMGNALDEGGIVNVAIAEEPIVPALPVLPAATVMLWGVVAAVAVGSGAAFASDRFDPSLRTPDEVFACLEIPVLASLPERMDRRLPA